MSRYIHTYIIQALPTQRACEQKAHIKHTLALLDALLLLLPPTQKSEM